MSEHVETTFVALKPDAVKRGILGEIVSMIEQTGMKVAGVKMVRATDDILEEHYSEHVEKDFYEGLAEYMKEGPVVALAVEGVHAVKNMRKLVGETSAREAHPATIRGRFGHMSMEHADDAGTNYKNLVHASEDQEAAEEELDIWFDEDEIFDFQLAHEEEVR